MADYRVGGAGLYLLVELPGAGTGPDVSFEAHDFAAGQILTGTGVIELVVADQPLRLDLRELALPRA